MDWFEKLAGFQERDYHSTRQKLEVDGNQLRSLVNGKSYGIGRLDLMSLDSLRTRACTGREVPGRLRVRIVTGDVRQMHQEFQFAGAIFQVASQFNMLEMVSQDVTPECGVTRYQNDRTQGPACAIAAGAATIYRNYFAPVGDHTGQTSEHQLDGFAELGRALARTVDRTATSLWTMQNGYSMFTLDGVNSISRCLKSLDPEAIDALRGLLRIGVHWDVDVTDSPAQPLPQVSQAFCSALPVSYCRAARGADWMPLASLVLEAAYEATLLAAVINAQRGASNTVLLTSLGGGAFGNDESWIRSAMKRAIGKVAGSDLDIVFVSYGPPSADLQRWVHSLT